MDRITKKSEAGIIPDSEMCPVVPEDQSVAGSKVIDVEKGIVEDENLSLVDGAQHESGSFSTRCSLRLIHDVVNNFDQHKRDLVKSAGFEGILHFPCIKHVNRKFVIWLMRSVDEQSSTLAVSEDVKLWFTKEDVCTVFGIPCTGKNVLDSPMSGRKAKDKVIKEYLGLQFKEHRSIKVVQDIIERPYGIPMSKAEKDAFRVAFVVFVVSTLLCPSAKHDYASIDYWSAIQDADGIAGFDWSEYVTARLLDAVKKLKQDLASGIKFPNITGCSLFLQVFYLDSIDLGILSVPHVSFPRIRDFSHERIRMMIRADHNFSSSYSEEPCISLPKMRNRHLCCYRWATDNANVAEDISRSSCLLAVFEAAVAMARLMDIPMEAAGPLFVAASDFQRQMDAGVPVSGIRVIKFMTVIVSILFAFKSGQRYHFSMHDEGDPLNNNDPISMAVSSGIRLLSQPLAKRRRLSGNKKADSVSTSYSFDDEVNVCSSYSGQSGITEEANRLTTLHHCLSEDQIMRSMKDAMASIHQLPIDLKIEHRLARVMSQFYSMVRRLKLPVGVDLNDAVLEQPTQMFRRAQGGVLTSEPLRSPWELGYKWSMDDVAKSSVLCRVDGVTEMQGFIIDHCVPKHIRVSTRAFRSQILGQSEMELDLFDAFIRRVSQEDELIYKDAKMCRWRHIFESDFMEVVLSGSFDLSDAMIRQHFSGCTVPYDITSCKLLFFPALIQFRWVCYVWCIESNVLCVFDPSYGVCVPDSMVSCHEFNCSMLKFAMHTVCRVLLKGWEHDWLSADVKITTLTDNSISRVNRSGVMCCMFCSCFDGNELMVPVNMVDPDTAAVKIAQDIIDLRGNIGSISQAHT